MGGASWVRVVQPVLLSWVVFGIERGKNFGFRFCIPAEESPLAYSIFFSPGWSELDQGAPGAAWIPVGVALDVDGVTVALMVVHKAVHRGIKANGWSLKTFLKQRH